MSEFIGMFIFIGALTVVAWLIVHATLIDRHRHHYEWEEFGKQDGYNSVKVRYYIKGVCAGCGKLKIRSYRR